MDKFFKDVNGYNDKIIEEHGHDPEEFNKYLSDYADLELGIKIMDCIEATGQCSFEGEN